MNKTNILALTALTAIATFSGTSCARKDSAAVEEPARESAWKPAAIQASSSAPAKQSAAPANTPAATPVTTEPATAARPVRAPKVTAAPLKVTLAEGSILAVRTGESLTSEKNETGDSWSGTLAEPIVVDGLVIAERGTPITGRVTNAKRAGRVKGVASLSIAVTEIQTADGQRIPVHTASVAHAGKDETKRDVGKVAIASGIGAAIGAIAGGGKGAGIGAGVGAGAGTGVVLATRGGPAVFPAESLIRFRIAAPVTITEKLR
ncbi:MAG: hypothetical protein HYX27_17085 [Acidobacteria bacterium]|nr:hypothetical protein [Acidobacteriota bacterium]